MSRAAPFCHGRAYRRTASGANTAISSPHQASDPATGCATGQAEPSGTGAFPNRSRSAVVTALTGFHSASARSQSGRSPVGM